MDFGQACDTEHGTFAICPSGCIVDYLGIKIPSMARSAYAESQLEVANIRRASILPNRDRIVSFIIGRGPSRKRAARSQLKETIVFSLCGYHDRGE